MRSVPLHKASAVFEVALAFAMMHVAFRAFAKFTALGQAEYEAQVVFSPGAAMILITLLLLGVHKRRPAAWGLTLRPLGAGVNAGVLCLLVLVAISLLALGLGAPFQRPPVEPGSAGVRATINIATTAIILWLLCRCGRCIERIPGAAGLALIAAAALLPLLAAGIQGHTMGPAALTVLWVLLASGAGEEIFFRGYIQSRLNEVFGRPWRLLGVEFGPGLFGAAVLFGLIHAINRVDYFTGAGDFLWWYGLATATSLYFGFLRERTGSVLAPAVTHGMSNLLARLPTLLGGAG